MFSKRNKRRNRHKQKQKLKMLDALVLNRMRHNYSWAMSSWGGTRCPGCGKTIRPVYLIDTNCSGYLYQDGKIVGHIAGYAYACDSKYFRGKCPGVNESWLDK